jgi:hypothetical protein
MGFAVCDQLSASQLWIRGGASLTEIANQPGRDGACSPLPIRDTALVVDLEAHLLVALGKAVQTTLMGVNEL